MVVVAAVGLVLAAVPVWAHHAFAAEFDQNKPIKVQGAVTKWELTNPHSWIHIDVKDPDGKVGHVDDRRRQPEQSVPTRLHEGIAAARNRDHWSRATRPRTGPPVPSAGTSRSPTARKFFLGLIRSGERAEQGLKRTPTPRRSPRSHPVAALSGAGLPNFASSTGTFVCISFSTIESRPSSHAYVMRNGSLIPLTSR